MIRSNRRRATLAMTLVAASLGPGALAKGQAAVPEDAGPAYRLTSTPAGLAASPDTFPVGQVVEQIVSITDTTQSYALYLPTAYDPATVWPVMYLMDPRGRALIPMELFRDAAERHGWVLVSSYNTMSDGPVEPNEIALDAMLGDTQQLLAPDLSRLYLCGFSGTARMAWTFATNLTGHVAGVIGVGGGFPQGGAAVAYPSMLEPHPFSFFGAVGNTDFNYEEMLKLDGMLAGFDIPHRLVLFEGPHTWLPKDEAERGVDWLEIQAMKDGLRPRDLVLIDRLFESWLAEARQLDADGRTLAAAEAYRSLVNDFVNLVPVDRLTPASERANELSRTDAVKQAIAQKRKNAEAEQEFGKELVELLRRFRETDTPSKEAERMIRDLKIEELRGRAAGVGDTADALAAQRNIETIFVQAIFYLPRDYIETDPERALASLSVARAAKPEHPRVCYEEARVHAAAGHTAEALDALECVVESGAIRSPDLLQSEPYLSRLAGEARFAELVERARSLAPESTPSPGEDG